MFSRPLIKELLSQYTLVQLYTDRVPPQYEPTTSADENRTFLNDEFGTAQLPLYVILKAREDGRYQEIDRYSEGKINDIPAFAEFLRKHVGASALSSLPAGERAEFPTDPTDNPRRFDR